VNVPDTSRSRIDTMVPDRSITENTTASVQGFGNVARYAIELYIRLGGKVISVACWDQADQCSYTYRKLDGINLEELLSITDRFGGINKAKAKELGYEILPGEAWIEQDVTILIPAAMENQITGENVGKISPKVRVIAEGANGPTTPEADTKIRERNIWVIPDFLANAGGVTCSYFEQVQSNMNYFWEKDEVLGKLDQKMTAAYYAVSDLARREKLYMRDAAYATLRADDCECVARAVPASREPRPASRSGMPSKACSKSASRSPTSSTPQESRTRPSDSPIAARRSGGTDACVIPAG